MIDPSTDRLILLRDFAACLPDKPTYQTVRGWAVHGRRQLGLNGKLIYLETVKIPRGRCTTLEAYYEFIRLLTENADD